MKIGDIVTRKSYDGDIAFKIIDIKEEEGKEVYIIQGLNIRIEADATEEDLELLTGNRQGAVDKIFNKKVNNCLKKVINSRGSQYRGESAEVLDSSYYDYVKKNKNQIDKKELFFGRPGRILHVDSDANYVDICLKTYKELSIDAVGKVITEREQPEKILDLVKEVNPDIVVITGHDGMNKNISNYMDLNEYRNSKYFVDAVSILRAYKSSYDELVIFAGACQSCYEALLDAGANFASSPDRILIHCLDPVLICEKIAYAGIDEVVNIQDALENSITGIRGVGGLQTRGKYREGYPKSQFI
ncbi:sporulation peptidase YabG [Clostridium ihumii]|uniref:sporulation peptidase YabG n=1 Tax=Clostridium ihumii TaxID=1470356 RepID=UPI0005576F15|nr:sporulation peptidase YabG [Clostridium ihumii]